MKESSNKTVSVIIVTAGKNNYLRDCLDSLKKQTSLPFEVIVMDNSLNPNLRRRVAEDYPIVKLYSMDRNLFYCETVNQGIKISKGDFILCLNDDVVLDKCFIEEALKGFSINGKIGMVSGKIMGIDGITLDSTGLFLTSYRTVKERGYRLIDKGQFEKEGYVFGVNGAVAFYSRKMLDGVKLNSEYFDADYHIFYEDLDIAWRAHGLGWKAYYMPKAIACHIRGATVRSSGELNKPYARRYLSNDLHWHLIKNRYLTLIKNENCLDFLLNLPFIIFYDILAWGYILLRRPKVIKKFFFNLKILKSGLDKRKLIKQKKMPAHS